MASAPPGCPQAMPERGAGPRVTSLCAPCARLRLLPRPPANACACSLRGTRLSPGFTQTLSCLTGTFRQEDF